MSSIRRISEKELRKAALPGKIAGAPPAGISPILRSSWKFARDSARRFCKEMLKDRTEELLNKLAKRFSW